MRSPLLSFVVPAHNEEPLIVPTLAALREAATEAGAPFELVVVDDASTDHTARRAAEAGARVVPVQARQIAAARNAGAAEARGDVLVFVDADTLVPVPVVRGVLRAMREGAVGGGAAVRFDEPVPGWARAVLPAGLWVSRTFRLAAGCFLYASRAVFERAGGFDPELFAAEELELSRRLARLGEFRILREAVTTSGRKLRSHTAGQILGASLRVLFAGRRGLRSRERLDLWYGPRSREP